MLRLPARPRWLLHSDHSAPGSICLRQLTQRSVITPQWTRRAGRSRLLATSTTAVQLPSKSSTRFEASREHIRASLVELSSLKCVSQSRAQLALRCLEQDNAPTRVAVLAASRESQGSRRESMCAPARFLRVLLADPLAPIQSWEEELVNWCGREEAQGLLLRYSPTIVPLAATPNSPLATLSFPSPFLRINNLEILLASLPPTRPSEEDIYVPTLIAPVPTSNYDLKRSPHRSTGMVMRYPVHKSIIFSAGLGELFTTAGLISRLSGSDAGLDNVRSVVWLPGMDKDVVDANMSGNLQFLDLEAAESAFDHLRAIPPNMDGFQWEYHASRLGEVQEWVKSGTEVRPHTLPGATQSLITSIMKPVIPSLTCPPASTPAMLGSESLTAAGSAVQRPATHLGTIETLGSLTGAMRSFSTTSHQDLKSSLDEAFASRLWNSRLAWYRIPFNLDNVGYLASATLSGKMLPDTEHEGWALAGRMWAAGFRGSPEPNRIPPTTHLAAKAKPHPTASEEEIARVIAAADSHPFSPSPSPSPTSFPHPYKPVFPSFFPTARNTVATTLIPPLHSAATTYVVASASFLFTSFFTTVLLYFSQLPLYTSFTATAAGGILSMGYLQRKWEGEKAKFERDVREVARQAVVDAERWGWGVLRSGVERLVKVDGENGRVVDEIVAKEERAKEAVKRGLAGLKELGGSGD